MTNSKIDNIDRNLEAIRQALNILANNLEQNKGLSGGGSGGGGSGGSRSSKGSGSESDFTDARSFITDADADEQYKVALGQLTDLEGDGEKEGMSIEDIKQGTYYIQSATIAMRGYLMALGEAGLSKNQKKMLSEVENAMMMIMKMSQVVSIASGLMSMANPLTSPKGIVQLVMAGGYAGATLAYGSKTMGGGL